MKWAKTSEPVLQPTYQSGPFEITYYLNARPEPWRLSATGFRFEFFRTLAEAKATAYRHADSQNGHTSEETHTC
jgi:hypothetical protein